MLPGPRHFIKRYLRRLRALRGFRWRAGTAACKRNSTHVRANSAALPRTLRTPPRPPFATAYPTYRGSGLDGRLLPRYSFALEHYQHLFCLSRLFRAAAMALVLHFTSEHPLQATILAYGAHTAPHAFRTPSSIGGYARMDTPHTPQHTRQITLSSFAAVPLLRCRACWCHPLPSPPLAHPAPSPPAHTATHGLPFCFHLPLFCGAGLPSFHTTYPQHLGTVLLRLHLPVPVLPNRPWFSWVRNSITGGNATCTISRAYRVNPVCRGRRYTIFNADTRLPSPHY